MGWLKGAIAAVVVAVGGTAVAGWVYYRPALAPFSFSPDGLSGESSNSDRRALYACNPDRAGLIILPGALDEAKAAIAREVSDPQEKELAVQLFQRMEQETQLRVGTSVGPRWLKQNESMISQVVGETVRQQLAAEMQTESNPFAAALGNQFTDMVIQPLVDQVTTQLISAASLILQQNIDRACGS